MFPEYSAAAEALPLSASSITKGITCMDAAKPDCCVISLTCDMVLHELVQILAQAPIKTVAATSRLWPTGLQYGSNDNEEKF